MVPPDLIMCCCPTCSKYTVTRRGEEVAGRVWRRAPYKAHQKSRERDGLAVPLGSGSDPSTGLSTSNPLTSGHHSDAGPTASCVSNLMISASQRHTQGTHTEDERRNIELVRLSGTSC